MNKPKTEMPPQIQKCHDVWANTFGGQQRIEQIEIQRMTKILADSLGRFGRRFSGTAISVTQFGIGYKKARDRLTKARRKR